jgi:hypothetical protein
MSDEFDLRVIELEKQNNELLKEAEDITEKLIRSLQKTIENWSPIFIEDTVKRQKELTKSIGVEGVRQLKSRMPEVTSELPKFLGEKLNESKTWTHRMILNPETLPKEITRGGHTFKRPVDIENSLYHDNFSNNDYPKTAPPSLLSIYREAQMKVIKFLKEFGYQAFLPTSTHRNDNSDKMFSNEAMAILEEYKNNHSKRYKVMTDIEAIKSQKDTAEVESIWNEA